MWNKWKNKLKKIFQQQENNVEEDIQSFTSEENVPTYKEFQARVTYRYPKQKQFRFPVIPDESIESKTNTNRLSERKVPNRRKNTQRENEHRVKRSTPKENKVELKEPNIIHKTSKEPFKVTEVPSPIYGFQKRENKQVDNTDIPAYIRRQETEQTEEKNYEKNEIDVVENEGISERTERIEVPSLDLVINLDDEKQDSDEEVIEEKELTSFDSIISLPDAIKGNDITEEVIEDKEVISQDPVIHMFDETKDNELNEEASVEREETSQHSIINLIDEIKDNVLSEEVTAEEVTPQESIISKQDETNEGDLNKEATTENEETLQNFVVHLFDETNDSEKSEEVTEKEEVPALDSNIHVDEDTKDNEDKEENYSVISVEEHSRIEPTIKENDNDEQENDEQDNDVEVIIDKNNDDIASKEIAATTEAEKEEEEKVADSTKERKKPSPFQDKPLFPFNVIMTPSDKRNLRRKQMEKRREEVNKSVVKIDHIQTKSNQIENKTVNDEPITKELQSDEIVKQQTIEVQEEKIKKEIPHHLLNDPIEKTDADQVWVEEQQRLLEETLKHFKVRANVVKATQGPSVTRFEVQPELGVKVSKIKNLSDDLKLNMAAKDIRIEAPIPGKNTVGIEIPNRKAQMVVLQEIFNTPEFKDSESPLTVALGLSIEGEPKVTDIQKMPHGLIAGATGSGKSVCINSMLISLIYKSNYEDVRLLLIDPKMVELAPYNGIPHLITPVITDVKAATQSLKWAVEEMEDRYKRFVHEGVRNIKAYNKKVMEQHREKEKMPFIVIVIDELADLMMTAPHDVEDSISRIAQKARACGIHLILATQRPSVDVITGLIKANIPTRIAFSVSSQVDSRTIIDVSGAEKLLGKGDMLFVENGAGKSIRLQGPFVSDEEIERVTNYARSMGEPNYLFEQEDLLQQIHIDEEEDELLPDVIDFILEQNSASTSMIQRRFKIGYNRAARLMDTLEYKGFISGQNGSKPREVLISRDDL